MNRNALVGVGVGVVVVVAAALVYFLVFAGKGDKPGVSTDETAARAAAFWSSIGKVPGATLKGGAATPGDTREGLILRNYEVTLDTSKSGGKAGIIKIKIGEIVVKRLDWANQKAGKTPRWADMTFKNITIPMESIPAQAQMGLRLVGIQEINLEGVYRYTYDEKAKVLDVSAINFALKDQAAIELRFKMNNVDAAAMEKLSGPGAKKLDEAAMKELGDIEIAGFRIAIVNKGLAQKLLTTIASMQGGDVEKFKANLIKQIEARTANAPFALAKEAAQAAIAFIKDPKTFVLEASPSKPVTLKQIQAMGKANPDNLKSLLGLRVAAE